MTPLPNTFQTPNEYVDRAMQYLENNELRVLIFGTRHILGWQDRLDKRTAIMSLTMLVDGFITEEGNHFAGCGLSRPAAKKALDSLAQFGFFEKVGKPTRKGQEWRLGKAIKWNDLENRHAKITETKKGKIAKAAQASKEKRALSSTTNVPENTNGQSSLSGTSHVPELSVRPTYHHWYARRTSSGTTDVPKQTHIANPPSNPSANAPAPVDLEATQIISLFKSDPPTDTEVKATIFVYSFQLVKEAVEKAVKRATSPWPYALTVLEAWKLEGKQPKPSPNSAPPPSNGATPKSDSLPGTDDNMKRWAEIEARKKAG
jgi:hypothetical protein